MALYLRARKAKKNSRQWKVMSAYMLLFLDYLLCCGRVFVLKFCHKVDDVDHVDAEGKKLRDLLRLVVVC